MHHCDNPDCGLCLIEVLFLHTAVANASGDKEAWMEEAKDIVAAALDRADDVLALVSDVALRAMRAGDTKFASFLWPVEIEEFGAALTKHAAAHGLDVSAYEHLSDTEVCRQLINAQMRHHGDVHRAEYVKKRLPQSVQDFLEKHHKCCGATLLADPGDPVGAITFSPTPEHDLEALRAELNKALGLEGTDAVLSDVIPIADGVRMIDKLRLFYTTKPLKNHEPH